MYNPIDNLNNFKSVAWKRIKSFSLNFSFITREGTTHQKPLSKLKPGISSEPTAKGISTSRRDPLVNLELRKNHPLFVDYHIGLLTWRLDHHEEWNNRHGNIKKP